MHPVPFEKLIEYAAEETSAFELAKVSSHVLNCAECTATVNHFRSIRSISRADVTFAPPAATIARAQAIFVPQPVSSKWLPVAFPLRAAQAAAAIFLIFCLLFVGVGITVASQDIPADSPLYPLKVTIQSVENVVAGMFAPQITAPRSPTPTVTLPPAPTATPVQDQATPTPLPAQMDAPPSETNVPPAQEKTPPGQLNTPPGQEKTPPGQEKTPPGQEKTPPGQDKTPPGQEKTPPGQEKTPPGQVQTPPGQNNQPPGQNDQPPGQDKQPPGQDKQPPGQDKQPPGQNNQPPGQKKK